MALFTASEAAALCGGVCFGPDAKISRGWKSDSREVGPGDGFVAIKGAATDGHLYIDQAIARGAKLLLLNAEEFRRRSLDRPEFAGVTFIAAEDTQRALALIAEEYLRRVAPRVIAVTGSVGKTTVRELTAAALKKKYAVHSAVRSFNTILGCSLTVLAMPEAAELLVLELGTNHFGEIKEMVNHFPPHTAIITEVAPAHLEGFGSVEGVLRAKMEICGSRALETVIYNGDNRLLAEAMSYNFDNIKKISVGKGGGCDVRIMDAAVRFDDAGPITSARLACGEGELTLSCRLFGVQHAYNMGYAFAAAKNFGADACETAEALAVMKPLGGRGLCKRSAANGWVIDEAYNANPASMKAALMNTRAAAESMGIKKWAILGGMRELGESAPEWHRAVIAQLADYDRALLLGGEWADCGAEPAPNISLFGSLEELISSIDYSDLDGKLILVKGSNSYGLKKAVAALTEC